MISFFQKLAADSRSLLTFILGIALFYFLVLVPLDRKVKGLNKPLETSWAKLGQSINTNKLGGALDINAMNEVTSTMESAFSKFTDAEADLISRVLLPEETQSKMEQSFQLVEYENALVALEGQLLKSAGEKKVVLNPEVIQGLPKHEIGLSEANLLWADLAFAKYILSLAIECHFDSVVSFEWLESTESSDQDQDQPHRLHKSRFRMKAYGGMPEAQKFLAALPLRGDEAASRGLPATHLEKPALYIERILMGPSGKDPAKKVDLQLDIHGFIYHKAQSGVENE